MVNQGNIGDRMVGNGLDLLLLALLVLSMINGLRLGIIRLLGGIVTLVLALLVAACNYKSAAFWLEKEWGIQDYLAAWISARIPQMTSSITAIRMPTFGLADPGMYLAYQALLAITFLGILILATGLGNSLVLIIHRVFAGTSLGGVNRLLGLAVGMAKSLLIMTLTIGIIYPFATTGAQMGLGTAGFLNGIINESHIAKDLLSVFALFQTGLGLNV
ncbi:MAG TPA: CvpA family protein [Syntrophomonadaceae bacterium]|nr:CvpA family protein [Syntrophomonadaceae bacterium]